MSVTRVGAAKETTGGSTSFTAAYNQAPTSGNLLVMGVHVEGPSPTCTTPTGWTAGPTGGATGGGLTAYIFLFWKVAVGADAAPSMTISATPWTAAIVEEWTGFAPFDVSSSVGTNTQASTASGSCNSGPLTTTSANDWVWSFLGAEVLTAARTLTWGGGSTSSSGFWTAGAQTATATQMASTIGTYTPTLAFGSGSGVWYTSATASMAFKTNVAPNAPTLTSPATSTTVDRSVTQRLAWTFSDPDAGDTQSAFSLRYRIGAGAWTTVTGTTVNGFWDAAPATFSAATYEWQVKTTDALGLVGPYSASSFFTAADSPGVPSITAPTSGSTVTASATVTWSVATQTDYQVRKVADLAGAADTGTVYYDSGDVVSSATRSVTLTFPVNNRWDHIQVRVKAAGLWSTWADDRVYVSWTAPMVPSVAATPSSATASIAVAVTNPAPTGGEPVVAYNDIYVSSPLDVEYRAATLVPPNSTWTWRTPAAVRPYSIRAVAVGTNSTTSSSLPADTTVLDGGAPSAPVDLISDGGTP